MNKCKACGLGPIAVVAGTDEVDMYRFLHTDGSQDGRYHHDCAKKIQAAIAREMASHPVRSAQFVGARRICIDEHWLKANREHLADHDLARVESVGGLVCARGGTILLTCGCGCNRTVARVVQPDSVSVQIELDPSTRVLALPGKREKS